MDDETSRDSDNIDDNSIESCEHNDEQFAIPIALNIHAATVIKQADDISLILNIRKLYQPLLNLVNLLPLDSEKDIMQMQTEEELKIVFLQLDELENCIKKNLLNTEDQDDEIRKKNITFCETIANEWDGKVRYHNPSIKKSGKSSDRSFSVALNGILRNPDSIKKIMQKRVDGSINEEVFIDLDVLAEKDDENIGGVKKKFHSTKKAKEKVSKGRKLLSTTFDSLVNFMASKANEGLLPNYTSIQQGLFGNSATAPQHIRKQSLDIEYDEIQLI